MRAHWLLLLGMLCAVAALAAGYQAWKPRQTGLVATEPVHQFGELRQGVVTTHEFTLVNRCDSPIVITEIVKSCACTKAELSETSLAAGQRTVLKVEYQTGRNRERTRVGLLVKYHLEDGRSFHTDLWLVADVLPDIVYEPLRLEFDEGHTKRLVTFSPGQLKEFSINRVTCTHPAFQTRLLPSGVEVEVELVKPEVIRQGLVTTYLVAETTSTNEPSCMVPLVVRTPEPPQDEK
jgi:hypothetical protein